MVKAPPPRRAGELPVPGSSPGAQRTPRESAPDNPEVISLGEETVTVSKRLVEREGVRVRLVTDEVADIARASLQSERLELERIAVGREVEHAPSVREENGVTVIPVLEEIVVVEKRLVLKEELRIRRVAEVREVSEPVTVRRQRAEIERSPAAENSAAEPSPIKTGLKGNQS